MIREQIFGGEYSCDKPIPGNAYLNSEKFFWIWEDYIHTGDCVDVSLEIAEMDYRTENGLSDDDEIPDEWYESLEFDENEYLIGDWEKNSDGLYEIVPNCNGQGFAASIVWLGGAPLVVVEWSTTIEHVRALCSPCCPGQANLDSGTGNIAAYTIPDWRI